MHVEHNVSKSVLKYLFGEKDTMDVQKDLLKARVMWHLWLHQQHGCANYINHKKHVCPQSMTFSYRGPPFFQDEILPFAACLQEH